ncbi:MAG: cupredoxin domain-containing protein [Gaiellaceae bacterium]
MRKLLLLGLVLVAAGCGGDGGDGSGDGVGDDEPFKPASGADYEVFASEFAFAPPFLVVDKPGTYTFAVRNDGNLPHNFTVRGVGGTKDAQPGETKTVELTLKAGNYEIVCTIPGHEAQGMDGTLNVTAG